MQAHAGTESQIGARKSANNISIDRPLSRSCLPWKRPEKPEWEEAAPGIHVNILATAWMSIAEKASKETDPGELSRLVAQLCAALEAATKRVSCVAFHDNGAPAVQT
jgi:hypothetical protein